MNICFSVLVPFALISGILHHLPGTPDYTSEPPLAFIIGQNTDRIDDILNIQEL